MRKLPLRYVVLATLILSLSNKCFSQFDSSNNIFYSKELPADGVLLDKGWKFHAGDNLEWANQNYDDATWTNLQLSDYNTWLPKFKTQNIGWFRLHLLIDSSLETKQLA